jgi:hypothetical protein
VPPAPRTSKVTTCITFIRCLLLSRFCTLGTHGQLAASLSTAAAPCFLPSAEQATSIDYWAYCCCAAPNPAPPVWQCGLCGSRPTCHGMVAAGGGVAAGDGYLCTTLSSCERLTTLT